MFLVVSNEEIAPQLHRMVISAPRVARSRKPGQFVIVRCGKGRERIPLTIADDDPAAGTITLIIQAVGISTREIVAVPAGGFISDVAGPLGEPTEIEKIGRKAGREALARDARAVRDAASMHGLICPEGHLQERLYSVLPFLARHGLDLTARIYETVELDCPDHRILAP